MSRYRQTWPLDDPIREDGDNGFLGFNSRENPERLPGGILTYAKNMRFDRGTAQVRKGMKWLGDSILGGGEEVFASEPYYDQDNDVDYIALVCATNVKLWRVSTGLVAYTLNFPTDVNGLDESVDTQGEIDALSLTQETIASTDKVEVVQLFKRLYVFRGTGKTALQWDGDFTQGFYMISHATLNFQLDRAIYDDPLSVPKADFAIAAFNRLIAPTALDQVGFSDILKPFDFNVSNDFYVNQGDNDFVTALTPFSEGQLIVFKRRSIHLITNVHTLTSAVTYEITRQLGCVSRRSVANVGDQVFFLSDNGVHGLTTGINAAAGTSTPVSLLKTRNDPLSAPIHDIIEGIDFKNAQTQASGIYFNNRYYLAVPYIPSASLTAGAFTIGSKYKIVTVGSTDFTAIGADSNTVDEEFTATGVGAGTGTASTIKQSRSNRMLIYNTINKQWESIDTFPTGVYLDDLLITTYGQQRRLFATSREGAIMLLEEQEIDDNNTGVDTVIPAQITTRRYTLQTTDIKRWHYGLANWENTASGDKVSIAVETTNPDGTETLISDQTSTGAEDLNKRFSLGRKRGYGVQLDLTTSAGRPIIRTLGVSGRVNLRSYTEVE